MRERAKSGISVHFSKNHQSKYIRYGEHMRLYCFRYITVVSPTCLRGSSEVAPTNGRSHFGVATAMFRNIGDALPMTFGIFYESTTLRGQRGQQGGERSRQRRFMETVREEARSWSRPWDGDFKNDGKPTKQRADYMAAALSENVNKQIFLGKEKRVV